MKKVKLLLTLLIFISATKVFSQNFLDDRTMKITEISTDKTYGYESTNPVKVGTKAKSDGTYLNALKWPTGERIHIADMKFNVDGKPGLEMVVLSFEGLSVKKTIYISTADLDDPKAPVDFLFKTIDDLPKVIRFPADSIKKVKPCLEVVYSIDDFLLKEKLGVELSKPDKNAEFKGGSKALTKFFAANPLTDAKAKQMIFRVSIGFLITCEGKAGNFQIITQGRGDLETYANMVLAIVNKMPQDWQPALKDGKAVDCYQALSFSVIEGKLDSVSAK